MELQWISEVLDMQEKRLTLTLNSTSVIRYTRDNVKLGCLFLAQHGPDLNQNRTCMLQGW